jgi:hypothetical protein
MKQQLVRLFFCFGLLIFLQGCKVQKQQLPPATPFYYSLAELKVPNEALPLAGDCKGWFPDFNLVDQPYSDGCKTNIIDIQRNFMMITNEGTSTIPIYKVMEYRIVEGGFDVYRWYFSDQ